MKLWDVKTITLRHVFFWLYVVLLFITSGWVPFFDFLSSFKAFSEQTFVLHLNVSRVMRHANWCTISFIVMENYKNAPQYLYGLSPSQMDMFMTEDNPVRRQSEKVTEVQSFVYVRNIIYVCFVIAWYIPKPWSGKWVIPPSFPFLLMYCIIWLQFACIVIRWYQETVFCLRNLSPRNNWLAFVYSGKHFIILQLLEQWRNVEHDWHEWKRTLQV